MSDHRHLDAKEERAFSAVPRVNADELRRLRLHPRQADGLVRAPEREDEQGAEVIRVPLFDTERIAYMPDGRLLFLDRASQPRLHAPGGDHPQPAPVRQSVAPRTRQPDDALPLWGSPGCAVPDTCAPAPPAAPPLSLVCSSCGAKPRVGAVTLEGGTHYRQVEHGAGIPGRKPAFLAKTCGKWRRA